MNAEGWRVVEMIVRLEDKGGPEGSGQDTTRQDKTWKQSRRNDGPTNDIDILAMGAHACT